MAAAKPRTIGDVSDAILAIKGQENALEEQAKELKMKREILEKELAELAAKEGLTVGGGVNSKWTVEEVTVPNIEDADQFYAYIHKKKWYHLLQRRPAVKACQELWEKGMRIPGIEKFAKIRVTVKGV